MGYGNGVWSVFQGGESRFWGGRVHSGCSLCICMSRWREKAERIEREQEGRRKWCAECVLGLGRPDLREDMPCSASYCCTRSHFRRGKIERKEKSEWCYNGVWSAFSGRGEQV